MLTNLIFLVLENFTNNDRTPPHIDIRRRVYVGGFSLWQHPGREHSVIITTVGNLLWDSIPTTCIYLRTGWFWSTSGLSCVPDDALLTHSSYPPFLSTQSRSNIHYHKNFVSYKQRALPSTDIPVPLTYQLISLHLSSQFPHNNWKYGRTVQLRLWVGSGRVGSGRVRKCSRSHGSGRVKRFLNLASWVRSVQEFFKYHGSGQIGSRIS